MKRTSVVTGCILPALLAVLPSCGDEDNVCQLEQRDCSSVCVNLMTDPNNCGNCDNVCGTATTCVVGECVPMACEAPSERCGTECVDTQSSVVHCGSCDSPCVTGVPCVAGACAGPLAVMQTFREGTGSPGVIGGGTQDADRDLFVLQDSTLDLTKINSSAFTTSRVIDHVVLPDGSIVFIAAEETEDVFELYRATPEGIAKLSPALVAGGDVIPPLRFNRDATKILYRADQDTDDVIDLYAVTLANPGASVKVNGALAAGGRVSRVFAMSANGNTATYIADEETQGLDEVFAVDLATATPGPSTKLNPSATPSQVLDMRLTSDGARVVYVADHDVPGIPQLFVVDTATPGVVHGVANPEGPNYHLEGFQITPDDLALVYTGSDNFLNESLWRVPLTTPPFASVVLASSTNGFIHRNFAISNDSVHVFFMQSQGPDRLLRVSIAAPDVLTLLSSPDDTQEALVTDFALSRDERSIVFRGGTDGAEGGLGFQPATDDFLDQRDTSTAPLLFHVDLVAPATPTLLTPTIDQKIQDGIGVGYFATNDGRVLFRGDFTTNRASDVYVVTVGAPGVITKVSPPLDQTSDSTDVSILSRF